MAQLTLGLLTPPVIYEAPPPVAMPLTLPLVLVGSAIAIDTLANKLRVKRVPKVEKKVANHRVLKLADAYDVVEKVCTRPIEIGEIAVRYFAAIYHGIQPHFPQWIDFANAAADFRDEVMNHLIVSIQDEMAKKVLQQMNKRISGKFLEHKVTQTDFSSRPKWEQSAGAGHTVRTSIRQGDMHFNQQI
jgi:hypothetical protein